MGPAMPEPQIKYYSKDIPEMPVYINGTPLRFEVLETADANLIAELDKCINNHRGGLSSITKEQYDEAIKKNTTGISSESIFKQQRQRQELSAVQFHERAVAEGAVRTGGMFARPQEREHKPHTQTGLPVPPARSPRPIPSRSLTAARSSQPNHRPQNWAL